MSLNTAAKLLTGRNGLIKCDFKVYKTNNILSVLYLWQIHVDIWQNQYNIVKLKNKIKFKKKTLLLKQLGKQFRDFGKMEIEAYNVFVPN